MRSAVGVCVALLVALAALAGAGVALAAPGAIGGLSSTSHPASSFTFTWNPVPGIAGYAYSFDRSPDTVAGATVALPAVSFSSSQTIAVGSTPRQLAGADFGNGRLDLAAVNLGSNSVTVLLGNGHGVFTKGTTYATGATPHAVAAGDFNGDGRPDLAVANWTADTVSVLLATGVGTFAPKVDYPTALNPHGIAVGDLGNGTPDIVLANASSNTISVFVGNGDGTFRPRVDYPTGAHPEKIAIGDFNGDGHPDLAVITNVGYTLTIFSGNGDGTFTTGKTYPTAGQPHWVVAGDLGNGQLDLVVANWASNSVSVYLGKGDGTFAAQVDYPVGVNPANVEIADVNGDGIADLVASDYAGSVAVLLGRGDGTFLAAQYIATTAPPYFLTVGDFNGDGAPDLALPLTTTGKVAILLNATGSLSPSVTLSAGDGGVWYFHVAAVDVHGNPGPTSTTSVTVVAAPTISSFAPGSAGVGATVSLTGSGFSGGTAVTFNGTAASFTVVSDTQITATVPAGATSGLIAVTAPGGTATSTTSFTVVPAPVIGTVSPTSGLVGATVTLTGTGFSGATAVTFNGTAAGDFTVVGDTQITATVPAGATSGPVSVTGPNGAATSTANFAVFTAPVMGSFSPASAAVGAAVTLTGSGFSGATAVTFNGAGATFTVNSDTQITATVPAGAASGAIAVTGPAGTASSAASFTVIPAPAIVSISPSSGLAGAAVILTGTGFSGATRVALGGVSAKFTVNSDTQITATVPAGAASGPISVTGPGGADTSAASFTVAALPTVTFASPAGGESWVAGTPQTVSFTLGSALSFGQFRISFVDAAGKWFTLKSFAPTAGQTVYSQSVTLPTTMTPGSSCCVWVYWRADPAVNTWQLTAASNAFTVTPLPTVTFASPAGGESWLAATTQTVSFTVSSALSYGQFRVYFADAANKWSTLATFAAAAGQTVYSLPVTLPATVTPGSTCRIWVYWRADPAGSVSQLTAGSNAFTVATLRTVTFASPAGGESWPAGAPQTVSFTLDSPLASGQFRLYAVDAAGTWFTLKTFTAAAGQTVYPETVTLPATMTPGATCRIWVYWRADTKVNSWQLTAASNAFTTTP